MWWAPETDHERLLAADISTLRTWYDSEGGGSARNPLAWGVGSAWVASLQRLMPLIVLNEQYLSMNTADTQVLGSEWLEFWRTIRNSSYSVFSTPNLVPSPPQALLSLNLPLFFIIAARPVPTSARLFEDQRLMVERIIDDFVRVREPIVCEPLLGWNSAGSASVIVLDRNINRYSLLTAGHVAKGGVGKEVYKLKRILKVFPVKERLGEVSHQTAKENGGWDVAVIKLDTLVLPKGTLAGSGVTSFKYPEPLVVQGAMTGFVEEAAAQGILTDLSGWKNVWMIAPSGVLKGGDSGSPVFTRANSHLLGMYVGQSRQTVSGRSYYHYVQDAHTLQQSVLNGWNIKLFL
jgi:hypothetical protein